MNSRQDIQAFDARKTLAVVGMSRAPQSFSANAAKELKAKGYRLFPVNPNASEVQSDKCYPDLAALPERVDAVLFMTPPTVTEKALRDAVEAGTQHFWIQQGAESPEALAFCKERDLSAVFGHCILVFAEPVGSIHKVHRIHKGLFGGLPR